MKITKKQSLVKSDIKRKTHTCILNVMLEEHIPLELHTLDPDGGGWENWLLRI